MMKSKMMASGGMAKNKLPMVKKDGKMIPAFAADGKGKKDTAMGKMKPKMAAGGGMMSAKKSGIGDTVSVRGVGAARAQKATIY